MSKKENGNCSLKSDSEMKKIHFPKSQPNVAEMVKIPPPRT